ncbi:MAG: HEPN domain-containing protein [Oscillospiraceae bacterium]|nr:HEPN domain-containing protein [Oscillospiraceae bacterium]
MKQANQSQWQEWVRYAKNDLDVAIREMERECSPRHRLYEVIIMHCQQSVEKILKAYVVKADPSINPKVFSHDLEAVRMECEKTNERFSSPRLIKHIAFLSAFVTARYPNFTFSIDASHATRGLNGAKRVYDFVSVQLGLGRVYFNK